MLYRASSEGRCFRAFKPPFATVPLCDDVRHEWVRFMPALAAFKFQREGERCRQVIGIGRRELFIVGHPPTIAEVPERSKNTIDAKAPRRVTQKARVRGFDASS